MPVLLLGGAKSPRVLTTDLFAALQPVFPKAGIEILDRLDHFAPDDKAPALVAERVGAFVT